MGLELILGGISAVLGIFSGMAQASAAEAQANATRQAAEAQKEANNIEAAQQDVVSRESRRQRVREERVRRARIIAASENTGTTGSSGQIGAVGALSSNLGGVFAGSRGQSAANKGINTNLQRAADFQAEANAIGAQAQATSAMFGAFQSGLSGFASIFG